MKTDPILLLPHLFPLQKLHPLLNPFLLLHPHLTLSLTKLLMIMLCIYHPFNLSFHHKHISPSLNPLPMPTINLSLPPPSITIVTLFFQLLHHMSSCSVIATT